MDHSFSSTIPAVGNALVKRVFGKLPSEMHDVEVLAALDAIGSARWVLQEQIGERR